MALTSQFEDIGHRQRLPIYPETGPLSAIFSPSHGAREGALPEWIRIPRNPTSRCFPLLKTPDLRGFPFVMGASNFRGYFRKVCEPQALSAPISFPLWWPWPALRLGRLHLQRLAFCERK